MKKYLIAALFTSLASTAYAAPPTKLQICTNISQIAGVTALERYSGVTMADAMKTAVESGKSVAPMASLAVELAYGLPNYRAPVDQKVAIRDFQNKFFYSCWKSKHWESRK